MFIDHGAYLYENIDEFIKSNKNKMNKEYLRGIELMAEDDPEYAQHFMYNINQLQIFDYMNDTFLPPLLDYLYNAGETVEKTLITKQFLSLKDEIKNKVFGLPQRMIFLTFPKGINSNNLIESIQPAIRGNRDGKKYCWLSMFPVPDMKLPSFIAYAIYNSYL